MSGWGAPVTVAMFVASVVLLSSFVLLQRRVAQPLLPLRVVLDRDRGGSYLAMGIAGIGMFGVFLFLTYYLQTTLGFYAGPDRPGVPADDGGGNGHGDQRDHVPARPGWSPAVDHARDDHRLRCDGLSDRRRRRHRLRDARAARPARRSASAWG